MREDGVIRKRLSDDEAAPYMGIARVLLGDLKNKMSYANLSQLKLTTDFPNGLSITVSSIFGQDTVSISVPVTTEKTEKKPIHEEIDSYYPYMFIGVRIKDNQGQSVLIHLNVWEYEKQEYLDSGERSEILSSRYGGGTNMSPLESSANTTITTKAGATETVFYTKNKLWLNSGGTLAVDPLKGDGNHQWDEAAIWDDEDQTGVMEAIGEPTTTTYYVAAVSLSGSDCIDYGPIECEYLFIAGRDKYQDIKRGSFTIERGSNLNFANIPLGYFDPTNINPSCAPEKMSDYGNNPHDYNWWKGAARIELPDKQINKPVVSLQKGGVSVVDDYIPAWGFVKGSLPSKDIVCSKCPTQEWVCISTITAAQVAYAGFISDLNAEYAAGGNCAYNPIAPEKKMGYMYVMKVTSSVTPRDRMSYQIWGVASTDLSNKGITLQSLQAALPSSVVPYGNGYPVTSLLKSTGVSVGISDNTALAYTPITAYQLYTAYPPDPLNHGCGSIGAIADYPYTDEVHGTVIAQITPGYVFSDSCGSWPSFITYNAPEISAMHQLMGYSDGNTINVLKFDSQSMSTVDITMSYNFNNEYALAGQEKKRFAVNGVAYPQNW